MDLRMPRLDGFGALERIRAKPGPNRHTPILAFTADTDSRAAERLQARGFQGLIAKPAEPAQLIAEIAGAVQSERRVSAVSAS